MTVQDNLILARPGLLTHLPAQQGWIPNISLKPSMAGATIKGHLPHCPIFVQNDLDMDSADMMGQRTYFHAV